MQNLLSRLTWSNILTPPGDYAQLSPEADLDAFFLSDLLDVVLGSPA